MEAGADTTIPVTPQEIPALATSTMSSAPHSNPSRARDLLSIIAILAIFVSLATSLAWPWISQNDPFIEVRNGFQPLSHGQAVSRVTLASDGTPLAWTSENIELIPAWETFGDSLPPAIVDQLITTLPDLVSDGHFPPGTSLYHSQLRTLDATGEISESESYLLRTPERDQILAIGVPSIDLPLQYNPPLDLTVSYPVHASTSQSGSFAGIYTYTLALEQNSREEVVTPYGRWSHCQQIAMDYALHSALDLLGRDLTESSFCDGHGLVVQFALDASGNELSATYHLQELLRQVTTTVDALLPPIQPLQPDSQIVWTPDAWMLTHYTHTSQGQSVAANSISPIYVSASAPFLLTATRDGPLLALDAQHPGVVLWRFQTAGSIYSQPAIDPDTGIIYFGSSDKGLYALTSNGLFLWQASTDDNVAAQPLLIGNRIIVASESGTLYAFNKSTGLEEWRQSLESSAIASPAKLVNAQGEVILSGSEGGVVSAIEPASGNILWQRSLDGAIHQPLKVDGESIYIGTSEALYALNPDGETLWSVPIFAPSSGAPAIGHEQLYLIDELGWLNAISRDTGKIVWRSGDATYVGQPLWLAGKESNTSDQIEYLVALSSDGTMSAFSSDGELLQQWPFSDVDSVPQAGATFSLSPSSGGESLWFADDQSNIYRLGPPLELP